MAGELEWNKIKKTFLFLIFNAFNVTESICSASCLEMRKWEREETGDEGMGEGGDWR